MKTNQYDIYAERKGSKPEKVATIVRVRSGWGIDYLVLVGNLRHPIGRFYVRSQLYAILIVINTLINDGWREFRVVRHEEIEDDESPQS